MSWPIVGQAMSAGAAAGVTAVVYAATEAEFAIDYFATLAIVAILASLGSLGQRRLLPRDLRASSSPQDLIRRRVRAVSIASGIAGLLGVAVVRFVVEQPWTLTDMMLVLGWIAVEPLRGVLSDAHFGFLDDRRATLSGDGLRWLLMIAGLPLVVATKDLTVVFAVGLAAALACSGLAATWLRTPLGRGSDGDSGSRDRGGLGGFREYRAAALMTVNAFAVMMTTQISVVTAKLGLEAEMAADYALGLRVAGAGALVQAGAARFVLPRATGLHAGNDRAAAPIRRVTLLSVCAFAAILATGLAALWSLLGVEADMLLMTAIVGLGYLANVASGPSGTVLIANGRELPVVASNVVFGAIAALTPLLGLWHVGLVGVGAVVAVTVALHHGTNARVLSELEGIQVGFWRLPAVVGTRRSRT